MHQQAPAVAALQPLRGLDNSNDAHAATHPVRTQRSHRSEPDCCNYKFQACRKIHTLSPDGLPCYKTGQRKAQCRNGHVPLVVLQQGDAQCAAGRAPSNPHRSCGLGHLPYPPEPPQRHSTRQVHKLSPALLQSASTACSAPQHTNNCSTTTTATHAPPSSPCAMPCGHACNCFLCTSLQHPGWNATAQKCHTPWPEHTHVAHIRAPCGDDGADRKHSTCGHLLHGAHLRSSGQHERCPQLPECEIRAALCVGCETQATSQAQEMLSHTQPSAWRCAAPAGGHRHHGCASPAMSPTRAQQRVGDASICKGTN